MAKTKLRWIYPPAQDLQTIEVKDIKQQSAVSGQQSAVTQLRPCQYGMNEQGEVVKRLYCTPEQQPRFFAPKGDGWSELQPCTNRVRRGKEGRSAKAGGGFDTAYMPKPFNNVSCHRIVAYAWCKHPKEAKTDTEWYKNYECDHKNCDHNDCCPKNLEWLTTEANHTRYHKRQKPLIALYGKTFLRLIAYDNLDQIFALTDEQFAYFLEGVQEIMQIDPTPLSVEAINFDIEQILDDISDSSALKK